MNNEKFNFLIDQGIQVTAVDIGESGGIVYYGKFLDKLLMCDMPETPLGEVSSLARSTGSVYAENVHTFPGQGVVSMGSLMQRKGRIEGATLALRRKIHWVNPLNWISCFTIKRSKHFSSKKEWKNHLLVIALEITGDGRITLNTADAVLLWIYAAYNELGQPMKKI